MLAPVCLFTYNRLNETRRTIEALQQNYLAPHSELYIFSDGPKNEENRDKVNQVRRFLETVKGFKKVVVSESPGNKGLANSIISGVTQTIRMHGKVIVLEDDLISSPNFLDFMNQALDFYEHTPEIMSVSGYTMDLPGLKNYDRDYYIGIRASSLGWGTWLQKWEVVDWLVSDYQDFRRNYRLQYRFFNVGTDMPGMLKKQMEGHIDSWAIRWCYHQFKKELYTVFASRSKINHIGDGEDATHAAQSTKFDTPLDSGEKTQFVFSSVIEFNEKILAEFKSKYSLKRRLMDKIKRIMHL
jgi:hypothetical protein